MDIQTALLNLQALAGQKQNELQYINVAIDQLKGAFAPKFTELDEAKAQISQLTAERDGLAAENEALSASVKDASAAPLPVADAAIAP